MLDLFKRAGGLVPRLVFLSACHAGDFVRMRDWDDFRSAAAGQAPRHDATPAADVAAKDGAEPFSAARRCATRPPHCCMAPSSPAWRCPPGPARSSTRVAPVCTTSPNSSPRRNRISSAGAGSWPPSAPTCLLGHSYFAQAQALLHDVFDLMRLNLPPAQRQRLNPQHTLAGTVWRLGR